MNYTEALNYIHSIPKFRRPLGNANLRRLLESLGNPQKNLSYVHIAGTNGKGSVAAMTARILEESGYRTGLFTSPYLEVFNERIRINGENIPDDKLADYTARVKRAMETGDALVSEFAFVTAVALLYLYEQKCDIVILEAGMGGRLDATNVIDRSLVSVICRIGLDHTQYLGNTVEEIAYEKCGIIRDGGTVVSYPNGDVEKIIKKCSEEKNARLIIAETAEDTENGFSYKGKEYLLSLKGSYQPQNAAVALETIEILRQNGFNIPETAVLAGLRNVLWPARFEFVTDNIIIDGGHNIDGIRALRESLLSLDRPIVLVMAMMEDKDYETCIRHIAPIAKTVVATELNMPRCVSSGRISDIVKSMNIPVIVNNNPVEAVNAALSAATSALTYSAPETGGGSVVCVCGSLYLAGEVRKNFRKTENNTCK
ncbi:MAG: bifunctional folylpolyglutamate synthase/dihydrofolate synthase [Oscillospiraceae bacterium]|nr:bifunctional folylpolyglutamate synthase/dihydrofolate synthase [Oscillospiraceae bacterium]